MDTIIVINIPIMFVSCAGVYMCACINTCAARSVCDACMPCSTPRHAGTQTPPHTHRTPYPPRRSSLWCEMCPFCVCFIFSHPLTFDPAGAWGAAGGLLQGGGVRAGRGQAGAGDRLRDRLPLGVLQPGVPHPGTAGARKRERERERERESETERGRAVNDSI
jgi:hypothetical protein